MTEEKRLWQYLQDAFGLNPNYRIEDDDKEPRLWKALYEASRMIL